MSKKALVVEDDGNIAELLRLYLERDGFEVQCAADGGEGVELFRAFHPDIVLLDIMLPVMDGWGVLREIRKSSKTPVIMLTAKSETPDKISGLEMGADDYVTKPFEVKELLARIHAVLRRTDDGGEAGGSVHRLSFDKLVIDLDAYELIVDGKRVDTPPKEMELLFHLASAKVARRSRDERGVPVANPILSLHFQPCGAKDGRLAFPSGEGGAKRRMRSPSGKPIY